jgi:hypothetical protein
MNHEVDHQSGVDTASQTETCQGPRHVRQDEYIEKVWGKTRRHVADVEKAEATAAP